VLDQYQAHCLGLRVDKAEGLHMAQDSCQAALGGLLVLGDGKGRIRVLPSKDQARLDEPIKVGLDPGGMESSISTRSLHVVRAKEREWYCPGDRGKGGGVGQPTLPAPLAGFDRTSPAPHPNMGSTASSTLRAPLAGLDRDTHAPKKRGQKSEGSVVVVYFILVPHSRRPSREGVR